MKKFFSLVLALVMALSLTTVAWAADMTFAEFEAALAAANGTYDGAGATVVLTESAGDYQNGGAQKVKQFFLGGTWRGGVVNEYNGAKITISNVNFVYADDDTTNDIVGGEIQVYTQKMSFVNCTFDSVAVNPWGEDNGTTILEAEFDGCVFENVSIRSAIQQNKAPVLKVTDCTFDNCNGGIHTRAAAPTEITITDNTFTDIAENAVSFGNDGNPTLSGDAVTISGNDFGASGIKLWPQTVTGDVDVSDNYWGGSAPSSTQVPAEFVVTTYYTTATGGVLGGSTYTDDVVATVGDVGFTSLTAAMKAVTSGATLTLLDDVTISEDWDCRSTGAKFTVPVTIDGNGKTLKFTGRVYDANWNTVFRFEEPATVKNLTIDASAATDIQRGITSKGSIVVENFTFIGNGTTARYGVIFGEGAGAAISNVTATVTGSTFKDAKVGVSDNANGQDAKSVTVTDSTFTNADVMLSASETVIFNDNNVDGGEVNITSYAERNGLTNELKVTATGNTLDADEDNQIKAETITTDTNDFATTGALAAPTGYVVLKTTTGAEVVVPAVTFGDKFDLYLADAGMNAALKVKTPDVAGLSFTEVAAKTNKDGSGNVAYIAANNGQYFVKTSAPTVVDYAVTDAGKNTVLYYVTVAGTSAANFAYEEAVTAFTNFSTYAKCGYVTGTPVAGKDYFVASDDLVYMAGAAGTGTNYLLNGKVVSGTYAGTPEEHTFALNGYQYDSVKKVNVPTSALCTKCMMNTGSIYLRTKVPATYTLYTTTGEGSGDYTVALPSTAVGGTVVVPSTDKVESAATFDAGIAMYVGMSVMAAAGSAVVIGKKKEF